MSRHVTGGSIRVEPALAGSDDDAADEGAGTTGQMDNTASGKVTEPELVEPPWRVAVPHPVAHNRVHPS